MRRWRLQHLMVCTVSFPGTVVAPVLTDVLHARNETKRNHPCRWRRDAAFRNFNLMRTAACLANQRTGSYCFVDAVAAAANSAPSDIYFYQLPLGTPLPGTGTRNGTRVSATCSTCIRSLMGVYSQYIPKAIGGGGLDNGTELLIGRTYQDASTFVSKQCGSGYANVISANSVSSAPARVTAPWGAPSLVLSVVGVLLFVWREGW